MVKVCRNFCKRCYRHYAGFTLVELVIVVGIIGLIATSVVIAVNPAKRVGEAQDAQRWADLVAVAKAVELYTADNDGQLPSDFSTSTVGINNKVVLCTSAAELTCDGQTRGCLVVDDADFLGDYLGDIPVDPGKSDTADTGYYVTRGVGGNLSFGTCSSYSQTSGSGTEITMATNSPMPAYDVTCGDGNKQGSEVCDDGDTFNEGCGNGVLEYVGDYCNWNCTANISITVDEVCDYVVWSVDCPSPIIGNHTESDVGKNPWCKSNCIESAPFCPMN